MTRQLRARQGDTLDLICWRYYGRTAGVTESVLAANPGVADLGSILPHGTLVTVPEIKTTTPNQIPLVQLWD